MILGANIQYGFLHGVESGSLDPVDGKYREFLRFYIILSPSSGSFPRMILIEQKKLIWDERMPGHMKCLQTQTQMNIMLQTHVNYILQTHVQFCFCKFCIIFKAFWEHKFDIKGQKCLKLGVKCLKFWVNLTQFPFIYALFC